MTKIKLITDSTADLPSTIIEKYNIEVLPLIVNFGEESYYDGVDINFNKLLSKIKAEGVFPSTSQINPQRFQDCYKKYLDEGYDIISIHLSSNMSGTFQSACIAKELLERDNISIIDSRNVTSGLGVLVLKAARLIEEGKGLKDIEKEIISAIPKVKSSLAFTELEHLVKGGRLSKTAGFVGNILGIKPILAVQEGEMIVLEKVRGSKKALKSILEHVDNNPYDNKEPFILLNAASEDILDTLRDALKEKGVDFIEAEVGCVVGTHSGPRACGVFYIEK